MDGEFLCPICSAGLAGCSHEVLRWSPFANEYEESTLVNEVRRFETAVAACLATAWERRVEPADPEVAAMYLIGLEYLGGEWDQETRFLEVSAEITAYVLKVVQDTRGVITSEEQRGTLVFYTADPISVLTAIDDRIRALELDAQRVDE